MNVTLEEIKQYLRIEADYTDEDSLLLSLIETGIESLENHTGKTFSSDSELAKLYIKMYVADNFENRGINESNSEKVRFALDNIVAQLSLCSRY